MKYTVIIILIIAIFFGVQMALSKKPPEESKYSITNSTSTNTTHTMTTTTPAGFKITDTVVGTGKEAVPGSRVTVNYTGKFVDGKVFDSSIPRGEPFIFVLGQGMVIKGWDEGVKGMKVGGKRNLVIPPELGYGMNDYHTIPGGSTLIFDVELLKVE